MKENRLNHTLRVDKDSFMLKYTRWYIPHCGQAKIEAGLQALVVPTDTEHDNLCILYCGNGQS